MNATKPPSDNLISFIRQYNFISPSDLENIMETMDGMGYLSEKGMQFRHEFWELFIKD